MSKSDDIALFVQVIKSGGLAAAGRKVGLSPASMTARMNTLERRYNSRLLNRTTRKITLTDAGQKFYDIALRIVADIAEVEAVLTQGSVELSGSLRITAPSDFGRQFVAPALADFVKLNPKVEPYLHLNEGVVNIVEQGFDLAIRFGNLPDSNLIIRQLANNRRLLCASPDYIKQYGQPTTPEHLYHHRCLVLERFGEPLNQWHFKENGKTKTIAVKPALMTDDGALVRQWAVAGMGIALKSIWDIKRDLDSGNLVTVLDEFIQGFHASDNDKVGLQLIYPNRRYVPRQVKEFINHLKERISDLKSAY